ncbi:type II toxin-antitoxin system death-on-curing family toxin [Streptomyces sp. N50]|uniref:type II toxin-antitoxin system death-on-curing family toxin n=1 Tax=Streptomyces sp. N50 TaxID=3081765 RepID=UPI0029624843|nr:Fic family protein [Streptomyces sp. N50]WOX12570.1 Fic family protein [Streptomyces sp. N50]
MASETVYLTYEHFLHAAAEATGLEIATLRNAAKEQLAQSALNAPASSFGDYEQYPKMAQKAAVLLWRLSANHSLPDGNKRTALLCAILFAALNGYDWEPPAADEEEDGAETEAVVVAASQGHIPLAALAAWVRERLVPIPEDYPGERSQVSAVIYPAEYVGALPYEGDTITLGEIEIRDVHGYNPAAVYVRRISGKIEGISVAEVVISVVGDFYAQEELDAENAEANRYPLGPKEYWRGKMVGRALYGPDRHPMTNEEFELEWDQAEG